MGAVNVPPKYFFDFLFCNEHPDPEQATYHRCIVGDFLSRADMRSDDPFKNDVYFPSPSQSVAIVHASPSFENLNGAAPSRPVDAASHIFPFPLDRSKSWPIYVPDLEIVYMDPSWIVSTEDGGASFPFGDGDVFSLYMTNAHANTIHSATSIIGRRMTSDIHILYIL